MSRMMTQSELRLTCVYAMGSTLDDKFTVYISQGFVAVRLILCFLLYMDSQIQKHEFVR